MFQGKAIWMVFVWNGLFVLLATEWRLLASLVCRRLQICFLEVGKVRRRCAFTRKNWLAQPPQALTHVSESLPLMFVANGSCRISQVFAAWLAIKSKCLWWALENHHASRRYSPYIIRPTARKKRARFKVAVNSEFCSLKWLWLLALEFYIGGFHNKKHKAENKVHHEAHLWNLAISALMIFFGTFMYISFFELLQNRPFFRLGAEIQFWRCNFCCRCA